MPNPPPLAPARWRKAKTITVAANFRADWVAVKRCHQQAHICLKISKSATGYRAKRVWPSISLITIVHCGDGDLVLFAFFSSSAIRGRQNEVDRASATWRCVDEILVKLSVECVINIFNRINCLCCRGISKHLFSTVLSDIEKTQAGGEFSEDFLKNLSNL